MPYGNNDSQIFDIANLLRKREEELDFYEKPQNQPYIKQSAVLSNNIVSKNGSMVKYQKEVVLLDQLSEDNVSEKEIPVPNAISKIKAVGIKIHQIKLY